MRVDVYLDYRGRRWGTVTLEVAPAEGREILDVDEVQPFDLAQFGLPAPEAVPVVGLPCLIAQKLHACTEPFDDRDNPRVRDLVDLQLVRRLVRSADLSRVRDACVSIFDARDAHSWPPTPVAPRFMARRLREIGRGKCNGGRGRHRRRDRVAPGVHQRD